MDKRFELSFKGESNGERYGLKVGGVTMSEIENILAALGKGTISMEISFVPDVVAEVVDNES